MHSTMTNAEVIAAQRQQMRAAHDALVLLAAPLNWATNGQLSTGVHHVSEYIRQLTDERDQLRQQIQAVAALAAQYDAFAAENDTLAAEGSHRSAGYARAYERAAADLRAVLGPAPSA